jgi:high-affinity iron transporter
MARNRRDSDFDIVASLLDQMVAAVAAGQYQQAESARIEAYAIFETGPEKRLLAFTPTEAQRVERLFWEGDDTTPGLRRLLSDRASVNEIRNARGVLDSSLATAQAALNAGTAPAAVVFNAATIVFREGLEAVLILASLLASMIGANRRFKRPLAVGALVALAATALLFVLARGALLSFGRYSEQLEAIVSIVAIGVLLLVMNWFFHKVYWTRWIAKHHDRRRRLLIGGAVGPAVGFVVLGFSSLFREGAETVLFLQALVLDAGTWIVVQGTLLGLAATVVVGALTLILQTKLPHKKMLIVTGVMIAAVLVTMVGSTVHTLQLVGWAPISPIPGAEALPYWLGVWFGVHGTWQGMVTQIAAFAFVIGSYVLAERQHARSRRVMIAPTTLSLSHRDDVVPAR